jgi:hypothetical protein
LKAASFEYVRAASVAEACEMLREDGDDVKLIAGGQSLAPMMAMRLTRPARLIDINEIGALKLIAFGENLARTGACTRQSVIARDEALAAHVPLLRKALAWVGHVQTRNRGTVGGSLAHADPAAELPLVAQVPGRAHADSLVERNAQLAGRRILRWPADHRARGARVSRGNSLAHVVRPPQRLRVHRSEPPPRRFCDRRSVRANRAR